MLYNAIDTGLRYVSYAQRAKLLVNLVDARCPQERAHILRQHLRDEVIMFALRKVILSNFSHVKN